VGSGLACICLGDVLFLQIRPIHIGSDKELTYKMGLNELMDEYLVLD
jgi:hypothetical protein